MFSSAYRCLGYLASISGIFRSLLIRKIIINLFLKLLFSYLSLYHRAYISMKSWWVHDNKRQLTYPLHGSWMPASVKSKNKTTKIFWVLKMSTHMIGSNHGDKKVFVMKVALFFEFTEVGILQLQCKGHVSLQRTKRCSSPFSDLTPAPSNFVFSWTGVTEIRVPKRFRYWRSQLVLDWSSNMRLVMI